MNSVDEIAKMMSEPDAEIKKELAISKHGPKKREMAWISGDPEHKKLGTEKRVELELPKREGDESRILTHTHAVDEPSFLTALPSVQDLSSVIEGFEKGEVDGARIISGPFVVQFIPTKMAGGFSHYESILKDNKENKLLRAIRELTRLGFKITVMREK